jgi:hypothetical protein
VLSADDDGTYVDDNSNPNVGGRTFDVFRVAGADPDLLNNYVAGLSTNGGLVQYVFGGTCSQVVARALDASLGGRAHPLWIETSTPSNLGRALGPPIGRVKIPRRRP